MRVASLFVAGLFAAVAAPVAGDEPAERKTDAAPFLTVRLVDEEGKPVAGAKACQWIIVSHSDVPSTADWNYRFGEFSDADGMVRLREGAEQFQIRPVVIARHVERGLMGVHSCSAGPQDKVIEITMRPECRVQMKVTSSELQGLGREVGRLNCIASFDGKLCYFRLFEGSMDLVLPPAAFTLQVLGSDVQAGTYPIEIKPGDRALDLGTRDLAAKRYIRMEGKPAPEIEDVAEWKNGPVRMADLKGKFVLVEFWGWWCGPCVQRGIPELFQLQDEFGDKGLAIVGIHVPASETDDIDSVTRLDEKLASVRKEVWKGRDISFPVAVTRRFKDAAAGEEMGFNCSKMSVAYGIEAYPTAILIGRDGNVVGRFRPHYEPDLDRLRKLLKAN